MSRWNYGQYGRLDNWIPANFTAGLGLSGFGRLAMEKKTEQPGTREHCARMKNREEFSFNNRCSILILVNVVTCDDL